MDKQIAAFSDIDGTLTSDNVWKGIMKFFSHRGERRLTHFTFVATHYPLVALRGLRLISETNFRAIWTRHLPWYFEGYDDVQMKAMSGWVAREHVAFTARADVLAILREHLAKGDVVALVSGAPTPLVKSIAGMWGVSHAVGSPTEKQQERYTGRMPGVPCLDGQKAVYVRQYLEENALDIDLTASYAYADSYSDLGLFEMVGHPVAVYPDQTLADLAREKGWRVVGGRTRNDEG